VLEPNLPAKPDTVIFNKVTIKGAEQAVHMFGPSQMAVAKAVADSVAAGLIPKKDVEDLCIVCGVFIHWEAADKKKIFEYNYQATKEAIQRAFASKPTVDEVLAKKDTAKHPFA
jgi:5,6,7,8-tetrahydromethanopterin hydro-lyase